MNNIEFAKKCYDIAKTVKTLYVMGGWGQPLTPVNKRDFIERYSSNEKRSEDILAASSDTFAFDCVCFIKSVLDGFAADPKARWGGATYGKPVPDITCGAMLESCSDISSDFRHLELGELLYLRAGTQEHVGVVVSLSPALAAECTPKWSCDVQITAINRAVSGYPTRTWQQHGKLTRWLTYTSASDELSAVLLPDVVSGSEGPAVRSAQTLLIARGCSCGPAGADGRCGPATVAATSSRVTL